MSFHDDLDAESHSIRETFAFADAETQRRLRGTRAWMIRWTIPSFVGALLAIAMTFVHFGWGPGLAATVACVLITATIGVIVRGGTAFARALNEIRQRHAPVSAPSTQGLGCGVVMAGPDVPPFGSEAFAEYHRERNTPQGRASEMGLYYNDLTGELEAHPIVRLHVFRGDAWLALSLEQRAEIILRLNDELLSTINDLIPPRTTRRPA